MFIYCMWVITKNAIPYSYERVVKISRSKRVLPKKALQRLAVKIQQWILVHALGQHAFNSA
jgi:hypothetical protein